MGLGARKVNGNFPAAGSSRTDRRMELDGTMGPLDSMTAEYRHGGP